MVCWGLYELLMSLRTVIPKLINDDQTGFLKGRFIRENIILIDNSINYATEQHVPGLLLVIDFEKAFDSLEWSFQLETVRLNLMELRSIKDATVAKTPLRIASLSLSIFLVIMSVCSTFKS